MSREFRFRDRPDEEYRHPKLNPYLELHRSYGLPVLTALEAQSLAGKWDSAFGRTAPLHVEIGTGNGFFLAEMARRHPQWNWLGVEIRYKRVVLTAKKLRTAGVAEHARIIRYDAHCLGDLLEPGKIQGIYINHPDPWPKDRHARNRLFSESFCDLVTRLVAPGGELRLKTDFREHLETLTERIQTRPWVAAGHSNDIAREGAPWEDDFTTNYQGKFNRKGEPVYALRLRRSPSVT